MKSVEVKFTMALATLKDVATAQQYGEACSKTYTLPTIETKLNCIVSYIAEKTGCTDAEVIKHIETGEKLVTKESANPLKLEDIEEAKRDHAILFGVEPKRTTTNKESAAAPIKKHNGRSDNFSESNPYHRAEHRPVQATDTSLCLIRSCSKCGGFEN
jgi:hypothetical protein